MKKIALMAIAICMMAACKKADKKEVVRNACGIPDYTIAVNGARVTIATKNSDGEKFGFVSVEYGPNGFKHQTGYFVTVPDTLVLDGMVNGAYDVYVKGNCGGNNWTEVAGPKSFLVTNGRYVNPNCAAPRNIVLQAGWSDPELSWTHDNENYFEVAYGLQGFNPDTGRHIFTNSDRMSGFMMYGASTYDFYVRANCSNSGFSEWSQVRTMQANKSYNICEMPYALSWYMQSTTKKVTMNWSGGTSNSWEMSYNKVENSLSGPDAISTTVSARSATIQTSGIPQKIYVFVRTKCNNANSEWYNDSIVIP